MVRIDGITKKYGKATVLDQVSFALDCSTYGLLGPNGAGKTTLFRIMTRLISSNSGTITIDGREKELSIGYLPQKFGVFRSLTAREQLLYFAKLKQRKHDTINWEEEVDRALELTNLTDEKDKKCGKLSGGMVRRLGIAQAILGKPDLILLDEPTVGLDIEERARLKDVLLQLRGTCPMMISSHIAEDIASTCLQTIVLDKGKVIYSGEVEQLTQFAQQHVWKLSEQDYSKHFRSFKQIGHVEDRDGKRWLKVLSLEEQLPEDVLAQPVVPQLEDGYLYLLAKEKSI